jgi:hypothetical protein
MASNKNDLSKILVILKPANQSVLLCRFSRSSGIVTNAAYVPKRDTLEFQLQSDYCPETLSRCPDEHQIP